MLAVLYMYMIAVNLLPLQSRKIIENNRYSSQSGTFLNG